MLQDIVTNGPILVQGGDIVIADSSSGVECYCRVRRPVSSFDSYLQTTGGVFARMPWDLFVHVDDEYQPCAAYLKDLFERRENPPRLYVVGQNETVTCVGQPKFTGMHLADGRLEEIGMRLSPPLSDEVWVACGGVVEWHVGFGGFVENEFAAPREAVLGFLRDNWPHRHAFVVLHHPHGDYMCLTGDSQGRCVMEHVDELTGDSLIPNGDGIVQPDELIGMPYYQGRVEDVNSSWAMSRPRALEILRKVIVESDLDALRT